MSTSTLVHEGTNCREDPLEAMLRTVGAEEGASYDEPSTIVDGKQRHGAAGVDAIPAVSRHALADCQAKHKPDR